MSAGTPQHERDYFDPYGDVEIIWREDSDVGFPAKLTPKLVDELTDLIEQGCTQEVAAEALHITTHSIRKWKREGRRVDNAVRDAHHEGRTPEPITDHEARCRLLYRRMTRADAVVEVAALQSWRLHFPTKRVKRVRTVQDEETGELVTTYEYEVDGDWRAVAEFLEKRFPDRYGPRATISVRNDEGTEMADRMAKAMEDPEARDAAMRLFAHLNDVEEVPPLPGLDPANEVGPDAPKRKALKVPKKKK